MELKLDVAPEGLAKLESHPLLRGRQPCVERQLSVYFDTRKGKLRRHGWALRVREAGGRYVQTIKRAVDGAGLFDREEWEAELPSEVPDADAAAVTPLKDLLSPKQFRKLLPAFRTNIERSTWLIEIDGGAIELALDRGEIVTDQASEPVHELELELKQGEVIALIELAQSLAKRTSVRLGALSKAERGFALAEGRAPRAAKAEPVILAQSMTVAEGFAAIVAACLRHFRMNEDLIVAERNAEALHQARVAFRRLRSALWLFRPAIKDPEFPRIRDGVRDFTRKLGTARNLDVLLADMANDDERRARLDRDRRRNYAAIAGTLGSKRYRDLMLAIFAWADGGAWRQGKRANALLIPFAARRLDRLWPAIEERGVDLGALSAKGRHRLRIDAKKIRYALEFLHEPLRSTGARQRKFAHAAQALQEDLGRLNDLANASNLKPAPNGTNPANGDDEEALLRAAERHLRRMRKIGPYWREAVDA